MRVTANATRSGDWWAVEVPEVPGLFTQAKRLDQIVGEVTDAAGLLGFADVEVVVVPQLPAKDEAALDDVHRRRDDLLRAESAAASANRDAVARLRSQGLAVRDVATLMGVSPQRISVLAQSPRR